MNNTKNSVQNRREIRYEHIWPNGTTRVEEVKGPASVTSRIGKSPRYTWKLNKLALVKSWTLDTQF